MNIKQDFKDLKTLKLTFICNKKVLYLFHQNTETPNNIPITVQQCYSTIL